MQQRLAAARTSSRALIRDRIELLRQMRQTMGEIRAARSRLQARQALRPPQSVDDATTRMAAKYRLTPREAEVALLLAEGAPNLLVAELLGISEHTARHHTQHVLVKLGLHSRGRAAALLAKELGFAVHPRPLMPKRPRIAHPA